MWQALIKLIEKWACCHDWEQWRTVNVQGAFGDYYQMHHFVCKKCGKFKQVKSN